MASWRAAFLEQHPEYGSRQIVARSRYATVFRLGSRQRQLCITGLPQHWLNGSRWDEIDPTLIDRGGKWGGSGVPVLISPDGTVEIENTAYAHQTTRIGLVTRDPRTGELGNVRNARVLSTSGSRSDATLIRTATGGIEQHIRLHEGGVSEEILLTQAPPGGGDVNDYLVIESAVSGVTLPDGDRGDWEAHGFRFHRPVAWDATFQFAPIHRRARTVGGQLRLYTAIPVSWLVQAQYPVTIDPDFTSDTADGSVNGFSTSYATARGTGSNHDVAGPTIALGQYLSGANYGVYRGFLRFDTSTIGGDTVTAVSLTLTVTGDVTTTDFDLQIAKADWSAYVPIGAANRDAAFDLALSAAADDNIWANTSVIYTGYQGTSGALNTAWINGSGYTYYALRSSRDKANTTPTGFEYCTVGSANHGTSGSRPVLSVTVETSTLYEESYAGGATPAGAVSFQVVRSSAGALTSAGGVTSQSQQALSGGATSAGALVQQANQTQAGSTTPAGAISQQAAMATAGGTTPSGTLGAVYLAQLTLSGAVTSAGALVQRAAHALTGALTNAGTLAQQARAGLAGASTPTGSVANQVNQSHGGGISSSGALAVVSTFAVSLAGAIAGAGATVWTTLTSRAGSITSAGTLAQQSNVTQAGSITPAGAVTEQPQQTLGGSVAPDGAIVQQVNQSHAGGSTPTGTLANVFTASLAVSGALTSAGTVARTALASLVGALISAGTVTNQVRQSHTGSLAASGALTQQVNQAHAGTVSSAGAVSTVKAVALSLAGALASAGSAAQQARVNLGGLIASSGTLAQRVGRSFAGTSAGAGTLVRTAAVRLAGALTSAGAVATTALVNVVIRGKTRATVATNGRTLATLANSGATAATLANNGRTRAEVDDGS